MAKEKIVIGINDEQIELKGEELDAFQTMRKEMQEIETARKQAAEELKQNKISAYKKLGLTDEEINAII